MKRAFSIFNFAAGLIPLILSVEAASGMGVGGQTKTAVVGALAQVAAQGAGILSTGVTAEHLQSVADSAIPAVVSIFNAAGIFQHKSEAGK